MHPSPQSKQNGRPNSQRNKLLREEATFRDYTNGVFIVFIYTHPAVIKNEDLTQQNKLLREEETFRDYANGVFIVFINTHPLCN
jgi:hypothetical protein